MGKKVVEFHPAAALEAEAAKQWYEERSLVAGRAFLRELMRAVEQVVEYPQRWA